MKIRGDLKVLNNLFIKAGLEDAGKTLTVDSNGRVIFGGASEITADEKRTYMKGALVSDAAETSLFLAKADGAPGNNLADSKWEEIGGGKLSGTITVHGVGSVGAVKDGDKFTAGMDTEAILRKLLTRSVAPSLSLSVRPSSVEVGSVQNVELTPNFKKNDAGAIGNVVFARKGTDIRTQAGSVAKYVDVKYKVPAGATEYTVLVNYTGNSSTGLAAGAITATSRITGVYANFGYAASAMPTNGAQLRAAAGKNLFLGNTFSFATGTQNKIFVIAVPAGKRIKKITDIGGALPIELKVGTDYVKSGTIVTVPDAAGVNVKYDVYAFVNSVTYSKNHTHKVEL